MRPMSTLKVRTCLVDAGCRLVRRTGRHDIYACPCGVRTAPVPTSHRKISAGVVRSLIRQLPCLPKGWLQ